MPPSKLMCRSGVAGEKCMEARCFFSSSRAVCLHPSLMGRVSRSSSGCFSHSVGLQLQPWPHVSPLCSMDTVNVLHEVDMTNEGGKSSRHQPHGTTKVHEVLLICLFLHSFFHSPTGLQANYSVLRLPHRTKQMVPASVKLPLPLVLWPPVRLRSGLSGTQPPSTKGATHTSELQVRVGSACHH